MNYGLPKTVNVNGTEYKIRSDFRAVLDICTALKDPDVEEEDRALIALKIFYPDFSNMPSEDYQEAVRQCWIFMNMGKEETHQASPGLYSWEQDFDLIIAAVNKYFGRDVRSDKYMHLWTFISAFSEIGDCVFAQVMNIRNKMRSGKKLEKYEREWYERNRDIVDLKTAYSEDEEAEFKKWSGRPVKT